MKHLGVLALIVLGCMVLVLIINQTGAPSTDNVGPTGNAVPIGNGPVYYFDSAQDFGTRLATFINAHPELRVVSIAPLDNAFQGSTRGYWVVVEKRR
jgi:hypothetical protein